MHHRFICCYCLRHGGVVITTQTVVNIYTITILTVCDVTVLQVLYSDRHEDDGSSDTMDREVQAANHTFNPEALSFQPIDSLSSSLSNLSLSPSSPVPPGAWSSSVSPSSALFSSPLQTQSGPPAAAAGAAPPAPVFMGGKSFSSTPQFTAASFAATKFGSTKLKSQAKRPTRLSPTELGHYFRQQQRAGFAGSGGPPSAAAPAQRPRSLSPRDPRLEFLMDQQQRLYTRGQLSPQGHQSLGHSVQQQQHHQLAAFPGPASPSGALPYSVGDGGASSHSHSHTPSPHLSPNGLVAFSDMLAHGPSPASSSITPSSTPSSAMHSPVNSLSPEGHKTFLDSLQQLNTMHGYPGHLQHLLVAN